MASIRAQLRRRAAAPAPYVRDDLRCCFADCAACDGRQLRGPVLDAASAGHIVIPTADALAFFIDWLKAAGNASPHVLLARSAYDGATRHRKVRAGREIAAFAASPAPGQRVGFFEDTFFEGPTQAYARLTEALVAQLAVDAARAPPPAPRSVQPPAADVPVAVADGGDDLLSSLLADVELAGGGGGDGGDTGDDVAMVGVPQPSAAAASTASSSEQAPTLSARQQAECRLAAAAAWLSQHYSPPSATAPRPLLVLLAADAPVGGDGASAVRGDSADRLGAALHAVGDGCYTVPPASLAHPASSGGITVMTLSQYLAALRPSLVAVAAAGSGSANSVAFKTGQAASTPAAVAAEARYQQLAATLAALQERYTAAIAPPTPTAVPPSASATALVATVADVPSASHAPSAPLFPPHAAAGDIAQWVRQGYRPAQPPSTPAARVLVGRFRRGGARGDREGGYVTIRRSGGGGGGSSSAGAGGVLAGPPPAEVRLLGRPGCNRALDGDEVAVEVVVSSQQPPSTVASVTAGGPDDSSLLPVLTGSADDSETADAAAGSDASLAVAPLPAPGSLPHGRVIGIVRRRTAPIVATVPLPDDVGSGAVVAASIGDGGDGTDADAEAASTAKPVSGGRASQWVLVVPMDARLPRIRVRSRQVDRLAGYRVLVTVDGWDAGSPHPHGHYVSTIGPCLDVETEVACVMLNTGVAEHTRPFPPAAMACLPVLPPSRRWSVAWDRLQRALCVLDALRGAGDDAAALLPLTDAGGGGLEAAVAAALASPAVANRRDLRWTHDVCSVDPPGCTDIDDALHARELPRGPGGARRVEVGVHIADVTSFVAPGSALDAEAASRATSVYLVDRRLDMLPGTLGENVCSLRSRVDRYAFSVVWELEEESGGSGGGAPRYRVLPNGTWVGRTIIRSVAALTYDQAKRLVAGRHADEDGGAAAVALATAAAAASIDEAAPPTVDDPIAVADFGSIAPPLPPALARPDVLDPARASPAATERLARERRLYPADPPEGGLCGAPVHPDDAPRLRASLTLLTGVAQWLGGKRAAAGALDFERGELRFLLQAQRQAAQLPAAAATAGLPDASYDATAPVLVGGGSAGEGGEVADVALPSASATAASGTDDATLPAETPDARVGEVAGGDGVTSQAAVQTRVATARPSLVPVGVTVKSQEQIHITIAELMIWANEATARLTHAVFPRQALLRHHAPAQEGRFAELLAAVAAAGFTVDVSSNGVLQASLVRIVRQLDERGGAAGGAQAALLRALALRAMTRAAYFATATTGAAASTDGTSSSQLLPSLERSPGGGVVPRLMEGDGPGDFRHYGLAVGFYTHFTSPIRRYADDVVHRLAAAALGLRTGLAADVAAVRAALSGASVAPSAATCGGSAGASSRARGAAPPAALPSSSAPSVAGLVDWSLGDRPRAGVISDLVPAHAVVGSDGGGDADALLDALLLGTSGDGDGDSGGADVAMAAAAPAAPAPVAEPAHAGPVAVDAASGDVPGAPWSHDALAALTEHLNERNQAAKVAGWECNELFLALLLRGRVDVLEAVVADVRPASADGNGGNSDPVVTVYVPRYQFAAPLHLTTVPATSGTASAVVTLPPALLAAAAGVGSTPQWSSPAGAQDTSELPNGTAAIVTRLPPDTRAALLREGALRQPVPGATIALQQRGATPCAVVTVPRANVSGASTTLSLAVLDRVTVAVTCPFDARNARRPAIVVELVADTPAVRALAATAADAGEPAKSSSAKPSTPAGQAGFKQPAAAAVQPAPSVVTAPAPRASLYTLVVTAPAPAMPPGVAAASADRPSPSKRPRRAVSAPPAAAVRLGPGRARLGGYVPPPPLKPSEMLPPSEACGGDGYGWGYVSGASSLQNALEYYGPSVGWRRRDTGGAGGAGDASRGVPRWASAGAGDDGSAERITFGGAPPDTAYVGRLHSAAGASGYATSKSGAGAASVDLLGSYDGLQTAQRAALERAARRAAEKKHDRIDRQKKEQRKGGK